MPAVMDDPAGPTIYRVSGQPPYPDPANPELPPDIVPRQVTLRDRQTIATIVPFASRHQIPHSLAVYLCDQLNKEIEGGDTYPMLEPFTADSFAKYWFQSFGAVMLLGNIESADEVIEGEDWSKQCLGSFYIKPNYPGRSSHVCNAGFLVTDASRNRGVGRLMGESYIEWAPRLGYTYSVFNLVYETNVASCKIWDALGFKRIGRVKGCGNLKSYPNQLIDAIIYGRDLAPGDSDDLVTEERFDKIKYYLKYNKYPDGADRAEKSRLRSAATHYKLLENDKLMLKDKEVISDPIRQYDIARGVHIQQHAGINKTTATIAEKFHWSRIKEMVSDVIRNCPECKELSKSPNPSSSSTTRKGATVASSSQHDASAGANGTTPASSREVSSGPTAVSSVNGAAGRVLALQTQDLMSGLSQPGSPNQSPYAGQGDGLTVQPSTLQSSGVQADDHAHVFNQAHTHTHAHPQHMHQSPMLQDHPGQHHHESAIYPPIDPQIINNGSANGHHHHHHHAAHHHHHPHHHGADTMSFDTYPAHADFQALLNATEEDDDVVGVVVPPDDGVGADDAVDRDLEMLIDHHDDDDDGHHQMHMSDAADPAGLKSAGGHDGLGGIVGHITSNSVNNDPHRDDDDHDIASGMDGLVDPRRKGDGKEVDSMYHLDFGPAGG